MYNSLQVLLNGIPDPQHRLWIVQAYYAGLKDGIHCFGIHKDGGLKIGIMQDDWKKVEHDLVTECLDSQSRYV
jgi:hypothetical protein